MLRPENRFTTGTSCAGCGRWSSACTDRFPDLGPPAWTASIRSTISTIDTRPPAMDLASADDYYRHCSLMKSLARIDVPGLIVHAHGRPIHPV